MSWTWVSVWNGCLRLEATTQVRDTDRPDGRTIIINLSPSASALNANDADVVRGRSSYRPFRTTKSGQKFQSPGPFTSGHLIVKHRPNWQTAHVRADFSPCYSCVHEIRVPDHGRTAANVGPTYFRFATLADPAGPVNDYAFGGGERRSPSAKIYAESVLGSRGPGRTASVNSDDFVSRPYRTRTGSADDRPSGRRRFRHGDPQYRLNESSPLRRQ